jgi:heterodisulfide reductase subunit C/nitrate reductase gamma subunit
MVFNVLLYITLSVFILGLIFRISSWFFRSTGYSTGDINPSTRFLAFLKGLTGVIFSRKIFTLIKVIILDVILQRRILKEDFSRWVMHMLIYGGFMLLILMHALGEIITASIFSEYYSTINPFFFLRDLFGLMVILGVLIAVCRRFIMKIPRFKSNVMDIYAIIIVAVIILSGIFLEGLKITSYSDFTRMVEDYAGLDEEEEKALESLWVKEFGLVSPRVSGPFEEDVLELGVEQHEMNCMYCHSSPKWAFTGYISAKAMAPAAIFMDRAGITDILYFIHILACFVGLALLPFSKMFHIISTPMSLLANSVMDKGRSLPANIATRQVMELDACVHCGTCSRFCSAMMGYEARENPYILPSEKMAILKKVSWGKDLGKQGLKALQEGVYLCTNCDRCTVVCPSGINLKELWLGVREGLIQKGVPEPLILSPLSLVRGLNKETLPGKDYPLPLETARKSLTGLFDSLNDPEKSISLPAGDGNDDSDLKIMDSTYAYCFECQNCTTVCPVVGCYENPQEALGLLPHQIMRCLGLGLKEMASGPNMLWDCVTCYQCQEHCPQNVKVADIIYDLKNMAVERLYEKESTY